MIVDGVLSSRYTSVRREIQPQQVVEDPPLELTSVISTANITG